MKKIFVLALVAGLVGCFSKEPEKSELEGKPFPAFSIQLIDSVSILPIDPNTTDKPIALFYYGTHCPYSRDQAKEIVEDIDRLKDIQFYFITRSPLAEMQKFIEKYSLNKYNNIIAGRDTASFVKDYYEITGVPFMALYKKDHALNKTYYGKIYSRQIIEGTHE